MGTQRVGPQLFYEFDLDAYVPADHVLRQIDRFLDMRSVTRAEVSLSSAPGDKPA